MAPSSIACEVTLRILKINNQEHKVEGHWHLNSETERSHASASSFRVTVATKHINSLQQSQRVTKCPCILCNPHSATCHFPEPHEFSTRDIILFLSTIIVSSRLCLGLPNSSSLQICPPTSCIYPIIHASHEPLLGEAQIMKLLTIQYSVSSFYLLPILPKHFQHHTFNTFSLCCSSGLFLL